jgi:amidase
MASVHPMSRRDLLAGASALAAAAPSLAAAQPARLNPIVAMSAVQLADTIRRRQASCVEVMDAYLDHIDRLNGPVNAIVSRVPRDALIAEAREKDAALAGGAAPGALYGFPLAVKDLTAVKGLPTTSGSPIFRNNIAQADAPFVARMRGAGAVFIGKTNTPEFGLGSHTFNEVFGATRNPYDLSRSAGGSSGGGAVALTLRMAPVADGSDHAGSLRNPAAWNNIFGFRPSFGRVFAPGGFYAGLSVSGPMARDVPDLGLLLSVMAGFDDHSPLSINEDPAIFARQPASDVKGKRIAWLGDFGGKIPLEPGVLPLCETALKVFPTLGASVEAALPDMSVDTVWSAWKVLRAWETGPNLKAHYDDPARRELLKPEARFEVESLMKLSALDVTNALAVRNQWHRAVADLFDRYDYLILPGCQVFPFPVEQRWPQVIAGQQMTTYHEWMKLMVLITMTGCPTIGVPAGFDARGLPMGLQIVAPRRRDLACLEVAHAYDQATRWTQRRLPPSIRAV